MKPVNLKAIQEYASAWGCAHLTAEEPVNLSSNHNIKCSCGNSFTISTNRLHSRKTYGTPLSCGCLHKKWTNEKIDEAIKSRDMVRITNCNVAGFQPSVSRVHWRCKICNNTWHSRVDNVINKKAGCPQCAGNTKYTITTLNDKLKQQGRTDLVAKDITNGSFKSGKRIHREALFLCQMCGAEWTANIHNVIKFGYGCPTCNDNISTRVEVDGLKFHSKLEYYFWKQYNEKNKPYVLLRQQKYMQNRRLTCDYYIPEKRMWIEITGGALLKTKKYSSTIDEKRCIIEQKHETFVTASTFAEIDALIDNL